MHLDTLAGVRSEMARLFRLSLNGYLPTLDLTRYIFTLKEIRAVVEAEMAAANSGITINGASSTADGSNDSFVIRIAEIPIGARIDADGVVTRDYDPSRQTVITDASAADEPEWLKQVDDADNVIEAERLADAIESEPPPST
jgi:hypothetical protein